MFVNPKAKPAVFVNATSEAEAREMAAAKLLIAVGRPDLHDKGEEAS